jgi:Baseplate J-like protein
MPDYIIEPLDTDVETLFQDFVDYIRNYYPDWNPSEGQLDVLIARFFSIQTAFTADMASRVLRAIFRYFGSTMANIPPLPGSFASATVAFTVSDGEAHTLPEDTLVGLTDSDGDIQMFALVDDLNFAAGDVTESGVCQAVEIGAAGNDLTGTVQMIELVDWIDSAVVSGVSSGGSDPEVDEIFLARLSDNLQIPRRPALPNDFALVAQNVPGVWRSCVIDNYDLGPPVNAAAAQCIAISSVDEQGQPLSAAVRADLLAYLNSLVRQNFKIGFQDPTYNTVQITYNVTAIEFTEPAAVKTAIDDAIAQNLSPANFAQYPEQAANNRSWRNVKVIRYLDLTTIVENVPGVDHINNLTFGLNGGAQDKNDKNLNGLFPLTNPSAPAGAVVAP